jgi:hypothetical protein
MLPSILIPDRVFSYRIDGPAAETFAANLCEHLKRADLSVRSYVPLWLSPPQRSAFIVAGSDDANIDKMFDRMLSRDAVGRVVRAETATRGKLVYGAAGQPPIDLSDRPPERHQKPLQARPARRHRSHRPVTLRDVAHLPGQPAPLPEFITRGMVSC